MKPCFELCPGTMDRDYILTTIFATPLNFYALLYLIPSSLDSKGFHWDHLNKVCNQQPFKVLTIHE